ncbi:AraC family transcriptional regulator [Massilia antarctica]|uniref:AraC family transcriptional regulator n=1 Tax=Massilia antarctica TaxID=2765360 RepID=UPI0006BB63E2|nr:AraC family transcriptional regulator [Massilia sp. H27-R4]MCY0910355.1 AraC family transcriptional regulator [Massilia sp. H27-R4]CUI09304.1 Transcriptional regulator, AraC family [Janthinobacterium sp. CG23_2]CUU33090.1 Transcriptional regulator, AraC family [Janthinobacterium sp. CG23_2]
MNTDAASTSLARLRAMVAARAVNEGRTDAIWPGLRYYRFSAPIRHDKTQTLAPGIVVVLQGRKSARLGASTLAYDEMSCLVLGAETRCDGTVVEASPGQPYLAIHMDLPPDLLVKTFIALADAAPSPTSAPTPNYVAPVDERVLDAFTRLLPATDQAIDRATIAPLIVEEIIVRLLRSEAAGAIRDAATVKRSAARIQKAVQLIQQHFRRPLDIAELAGAVAMSPSHFAHTFREVAGLAPMHFLRNTRLDEARVLLLAGGRRPGEVAAMTGFDSAAHFTREFKRRYGAPPAQYVRQLASQQPQSI